MGELLHRPTNFKPKPIRERFEDEQMDQEFHKFGVTNALPNMLQMFPDVSHTENSFHANDWQAEEPTKATVDLLGCRRTNVGGTQKPLVPLKLRR